MIHTDRITSMGSGWIGIALYPEIKFRILQHFVQNPKLRQNQAGIAASLSVPKVSVSRGIADLVALRILHEERHGRSAVYSLNPDSILVNRLLREIVSLNQSLLPGWVKERVKDLPPRIRGILKKVILFGSAARGDLRASSDVDLLAVLSKRDEDIELELRSALVLAGSEGGLSIHLQIEDRDHFESSKQTDFVGRAKSEGKVLWSA